MREVEGGEGVTLEDAKAELEEGVKKRVMQGRRGVREWYGSGADEVPAAPWLY